MGNHVRQFNVTYIAAEDRILLRLNTSLQEEFRIWLTRRIVRKLALELGRGERRLLGLENPESGYVTPGARAIQEFRREASTANVDFGERFVDGTAGFPFGTEPVLAVDCEVRLQEKLAAVTLVLGNRQNLNFMLDAPGVHGTLAMLQKAVSHSDWDLGHELDSPAAQPTRQAGLH